MRALLVAFLVMAFGSSAKALNPQRHVTQYGHTAWRIQDGTIPGAATTITQTKDGYIWIGTSAGLARFDGVKFAAFSESPGEALRHPMVLSLHADDDGSLWIGTHVALEHWKDGHLIHYPVSSETFKGLNFRSVRRMGDGSLWWGTEPTLNRPSPLCVMRSTGQCFGQSDGLSAKTIQGILQDPDGSFWVHSDTSLYHWDPVAKRELPGGIRDVSPQYGIQNIAFDLDGRLLIALHQTGAHSGLSVVRNGHLEPYDAQGLDVNRISGSALLCDSRGTLWIGTEDDGIYVVRGHRAEHYAAIDGLSNDTVEAFYEDREGNIWVATHQGVDRFRDLPVSTYTTREGLSGNDVGSVLATSDGSIWVNNNGSLDIIHPDGQVSALKAGRELPGSSINAMMQDSQGRIWVAIDSDLGVMEGGRYRSLLQPRNRNGVIAALAEERDGDVWAVMVRQSVNSLLLHFAHDKLVESIPDDKTRLKGGPAIALGPQSGILLPLAAGNILYWHDGRGEEIDLHLPSKASDVQSILTGTDGSIYVGSRWGLTIIRGQAVKTMSTANGLPCDLVYSVIQTAEAFWLYTSCGIVQLKAADVARWWEQPEAALHVLLLAQIDGAEGAMGCCFPRSAVAPDGRMWFSNATALQMLDPRDVIPPGPPLPVVVEQLVAAGRNHPLTDSVNLPPLTKNLRFDYTSPSFATPQRVRYRYRLEGLDDGWTETGDGRQASYTNLQPGPYRFRVSAAAAGSEWSPETSVTFHIQPKFYETRWFEALCGLAAAILLMLLYRVRVHMIKRALRARLQVRIDERERIARDLHDTLFQDIQGLLLAFDNTTNLLPEQPARSAFKTLLQRSDHIMTASRKHVLELRTQGSEQTSLADALTHACMEMEQLHSIRPKMLVVGTASALHPLVVEEVYRVCREALLNACRHASASRIEVLLSYSNDTLSICVSDDGAGIDDLTFSEGGRPGHFGLRGMTERARTVGAELTIRSAPKRGTQIFLSMTLKKAIHGPRWTPFWPRKFLQGQRASGLR